MSAKELEDLVWARIAGSPHAAGLSPGERREAWLATLAELTGMQKDLTELADKAAARAVEYGADYPDLGRAAGITRQGARRRWPGLPVPRGFVRRRGGTPPVNAAVDDLLSRQPSSGFHVDIP